MMRPSKFAAAAVLSLAMTATFGATTASAASPAANPADSVSARAPWIKWGTYSTQAVCGQTGHNLVNRDIYLDYKCTRTLGGWELWVHN
jgi:hypothetical protein